MKQTRFGKPPLSLIIWAITTVFYFLLNNAENGLVWNWALKGNKEKLYLTDSNGSGSIVPAETGTYAITLDIASLTFTMDKQ